MSNIRNTESVWEFEGANGTVYLKAFALPEENAYYRIESEGDLAPSDTAYLIKALKQVQDWFHVNDPDAPQITMNVSSYTR